MTPEIEQFLHEKLLEERFWNAPLLSEQINTTFGVTIGLICQGFGGASVQDEGLLLEGRR